jgi:hypothetical protein
VLLRLLAASYQAHGWRVLTVDFLAAAPNDQSFQACWNRDVKIPLSELLTPGQQHTVLLVDEVQKLFSLEPPTPIIEQFFSSLRALRLLPSPPSSPLSAAAASAAASCSSSSSSSSSCSPSPSSPPRFFALCFGSYGNEPGGTASAFHNTTAEPDGYRKLGLSDLRLNDRELRHFLNVRATTEGLKNRMSALPPICVLDRGLIVL